MKKRLTAMLMVVALLVSLLSTGAMAVEGPGTDGDKPVTEVSNGGDGGITINKEVTTENGQSSLSIEAYVQGSVSAPTAQPLDIVLVLDQSGSMSDEFGNTTRQAAMKQAVQEFIKSVAANSGDKHRMAIVTFGNGASTLQSWTIVNENGERELLYDVSNLPDYISSAATNVAAGMTQAESLMNSARDKAQKVVIVFTDGVPTTSNEFSTSVANNAIETAYDLKQRSVTIYTIGIFGGADPNQLYGSSGFDTNSDGTIDSQWIVDEWGLFPGWDFPEADVPAANRFLNYLSSNYANSNSIGLNRDTSGLGFLHSKITYTITENFARGESKYYLTASDSDSLTDVFEEIAGEINPSVNADETSVLTDTLSDYFVFGTLGSGSGDYSNVTVEVYNATGNSNEPSWTKDPSSSGINVRVNGKTIDVTGFDYAENAVVFNENTDQWQGKKLVITFPIQLNEGATWGSSGNYDTNAAESAGLQDNSNEFFTGGMLEDSPEVYVETYSVDYKFVASDGSNLPEGVTEQLIKPATKYYLSTVTNPANGLATAIYNNVEVTENGVTGVWTPARDDNENLNWSYNGDAHTYTLTWTYTQTEITTNNKAGYFIMTPNSIPDDFDPSVGYSPSSYLPFDDEQATGNTSGWVDQTTGYIGYITDTAVADLIKKENLVGDMYRMSINAEEYAKYLIVPEGTDLGSIWGTYGEGITSGAYEIVWYQINNDSLSASWPEIDATGASTPDNTYHVDGYIKGVTVDVMYVANDGSDSQATYTDGNKTTGDSYTVLGNDGSGTSQNFVRTGYTFTGWNTAANGTGTAYVAGETINPLMSDVVLYAQWTRDESQTKELSYTVEYRVDNAEGELLDSENVTVNIWVNDTTYTVTSVPVKTFSGYKVADSGSTALPATVSNGDTIYVIYVKDESQTKDLKATVDYKLGDEIQADDHIDLTDTVHVLEPDTLSTEGVEANTYTGWKLVSITINDVVVDSLPATVNDGDAVVYNYVKDDSQTKELSYTVEYRVDNVDGELLGSETVNVDIWVNDTTYTVTSVPEKTFLGYKVADSGSTALPATVSDGDTIYVIYVKDESQTKELSYTVEYYKDGELAETDTVTETVWINDTEVPVDDSKINTTNKYEGYTFDKTDPTSLPESIAANGVIKVYYTKDKVYTITIIPADIDVYTGGEPYAGIVNGEGALIGSTTDGLPAPGYHFELSPDLNAWMDNENVTEYDLSNNLTFTSTDGSEWTLVLIGTYSTTPEIRYVYSLVPADNTNPVRIVYRDGDVVVDDDEFTMTADAPFQQYSMSVFEGELDNITGTIKVESNTDGEVHEISDISVSVEPGILTIRSTVDKTDNTNAIVTDEDNVDPDTQTAVASDGTKYYVNNSEVEVDSDRVELLVDEVSNSPEFNANMGEHAVELIDNHPETANLSDASYELAYMDLVDTENGNTVVTLGDNDSLTIYWPVPDDAVGSTFYIVHYEGLDRLSADSSFDSAEILDSEVVRIDGQRYVTFDVDSFSPFVLVYETDDGYEPIIPTPDDDTEYVPKWLNTEDHFAYIVGYEDGEVKPNNNITRAEVATIFFRLLTDDARARYWSQTNDYTDVAADSWYNNAISTLSNMGIINGYEDGTFKPNASITRAEFTAIATRFFDYTAEYDGAFNDVSRSAWYADCVQAAVDMGLVDGYPDGGFHPNSNITRAEAVTIVNRVLNRAPHEDHLLDEDEMNVWPDNVYGAWYYADMQEATNSHDYDWIRVFGERVEEWTEKLPERDWAALEQEWSSAYSG